MNVEESIQPRDRQNIRHAGTDVDEREATSAALDALVQAHECAEILADDVLDISQVEQDRTCRFAGTLVELARESIRLVLDPAIPRSENRPEIAPVGLNAEFGSAYRILLACNNGRAAQRHPAG